MGSGTKSAKLAHPQSRFKSKYISWPTNKVYFKYELLRPHFCPLNFIFIVLKREMSNFLTKMKLLIYKFWLESVWVWAKQIPESQQFPGLPIYLTFGVVAWNQRSASNGAKFLYLYEASPPWVSCFAMDMRRSKILLLLYLWQLKNRCNIQRCT